MNFLLAMNSAAAGSGDAASATGSGMVMILFMAFVIVYFVVIMRKDKKKQQDEQSMRESVKIGDEVLTIGGVVGRVVTVREDSIDIETGADRIKIRFTKQAIAKNITADKKAEEIRQAKLAEAKNKAGKIGKK
jgi:preprotein translocase subunit YajC